MWNLQYTQSLISDIQSEIIAINDYIKEVDFDVDINKSTTKRHALIGKEAKLIMILESMQSTMECGDMDDYINRKNLTRVLIKEYEQLCKLSSNITAPASSDPAIECICYNEFDEYGCKHSKSGCCPAVERYREMSVSNG